MTAQRTWTEQGLTHEVQATHTVYDHVHEQACATRWRVVIDAHNSAAQRRRKQKWG